MTRVGITCFRGPALTAPGRGPGSCGRRCRCQRGGASTSPAVTRRARGGMGSEAQRVSEGSGDQMLSRNRLGYLME